MNSYLVHFPMMVDLGSDIVPKVRMTRGSVKRAIALKRQGKQTKEMKVLKQQEFIGYTVLSKFNDLGIEKCPEEKIGWCINAFTFINGLIRENRWLGDSDNILKTVIDGLTGVVYANDRKVLECSNFMFDSSFIDYKEFNGKDRLLVSLNNSENYVMRRDFLHQCDMCMYKNTILFDVNNAKLCLICLSTNYNLNLKKFLLRKQNDSS